MAVSRKTQAPGAVVRNKPPPGAARFTYIGTAGWSIPAVHASSFGEGGSHLDRYATRLNAVEINSSFYRPHQRKTYERWARTVPADFRFAVKVPKLITHELRLEGCDEALERFVGEADGLGDRLGVLLVQLPPSLEFDAGVARRFFGRLRSHADAIGALVTCEPRHATWFTGKAEDLLVEHEVARVAADPQPVPGAGEPGGWLGLVYYRLHGSPRMYYSNYDASALEDMQKRLEVCATSGTPAWCIFDNTAEQAATGNALTLTTASRA